MGIDTRYKDLACCKNLTPKHRECLDNLAKVYGEQLNGLVKAGGSLFTLHDFDHHCYGLYRIINNSLCNMDTDAGGEDPQKLSEYELFLLDLAVLLHDIGMSASLNLEVNRASHASRSAEFILSEWGNSSSTLYIWGTEAGLSKSDIAALVEIVKAHSDDKEADDSSKTGISSPKLLERMPSSAPRGTVRAKLLAGILRMADELDITIDRQGNARLTEQLDPSNDENRYSLNCWEKLTYFSQVEFDPNNHVQLNLVVSDSDVQEKIDRSDGDAVFADIWDVYQKVVKEWRPIQREIFRKTEGGHGIIRVETIQVSSALPDVNNYLTDKNKKREDLSAPPQGGAPLRLEKQPAGKADEPIKAVLQPRKEQEQAKEAPPGNEPEVLSLALKAEMDAQIRSKKLIRPGHFIMHGDLCARDWIDTAAVLREPELFEKCIQAMAYHIKNNDKIDLGNAVILGIDLNGTLLGVRVAAALQCPFMLLVPPQRMNTSGGRDGETELSSYTHAVCITDAISSGFTISEAARQRGIEAKLHSTYTLLYRPPQCVSRTLPLELPCPLYCISDTFSIEVVESKNCQWKANGSCLDCNKIIQ